MLVYHIQRMPWVRWLLGTDKAMWHRPGSTVRWAGKPGVFKLASSMHPAGPFMTKLGFSRRRSFGTAQFVAHDRWYGVIISDYTYMYLNMCSNLNIYTYMYNLLFWIYSIISQVGSLGFGFEGSVSTWDFGTQAGTWMLKHLSAGACITLDVA